MCYGFEIKGKDITLKVSGVIRIMQVKGMFKHITIGGDKLDGEGEGIRIHGSWRVNGGLS